MPLARITRKLANKLTNRLVCGLWVTHRGLEAHSVLSCHFMTLCESTPEPGRSSGMTDRLYPDSRKVFPVSAYRGRRSRRSCWMSRSDHVRRRTAARRTAWGANLTAAANIIINQTYQNIIIMNGQGGVR